MTSSDSARSTSTSSTPRWTGSAGARGGSTTDPPTLATQVEKVRGRFGLAHVVLVGDRGMLTAVPIREELRTLDEMSWITTLRAPTIRKLVRAGAVQPSPFDERNLAKITSDEFPGEWLIVCRNPFIAHERHRKRKELIAATEREPEKVAVATCRECRPLRGMDTIGTRVGKLINRYKVANHFVTTISEEAFTYERDLEKIAIEEAVDGIYVVRSNIDPDRLDAAETVRAYKNLSGIEYAFRSLKTIDLEVRPIYHRREHRVRAHILLCMLAHYVE